MDKNVHPVAAVLVVLVSIITLSTWLWLTGEAKKLGGPSELSVGPNGHLYIQIQDRLIEHDQAGAFVTSHNLNDLNIETVIGGMGFFSNGDILLRRGKDTRSIGDTVRAFMRIANDDSLVPDDAEAGLFRCDLLSKHCQIFGDERFDFKSAFGIFIDHATDDVYISDTSRHVIRKYDVDGRVAAGSVSGFQFPNQLMLYNGALLVADTNHHRIKVVASDTDEFGGITNEIEVVSAEAKSAGHRWPNHFGRVQEEWWVNNMSSNMDYGGIYAFDSAWNYQRRIALPDNADPIALVVFNNDVLISDWYGDRVHRVSLEGEYMGDFESAGLMTIIAESERQRNYFNLLAWLAVMVGATLVVAFVIKGTDWSQSAPAEPDNLVSNYGEGSRIVMQPDPKNVKKIKANLVFARLLFIHLALV